MKHDNMKHVVRTSAVNTVVRARVEQTDGQAIRSRAVGRKREATGRMSKERKAKHLDAKATAIGIKN